jgi:8-oxo-dGTP pyrophosphatase MutT (NUDIX family)
MGKGNDRDRRGSSDAPQRGRKGVRRSAIDNTDEAWQMPQGGIDDDDDDEWATALRELEEETGIPPNLVERVSATPERLKYDLPKELRSKLWGGKWKGQDQDWFLARFLGTDAGREHRDRASRIPRLEMDRAHRASRADRPVQARAVPAAAARVRGLSLRRGEIADAAADEGAEDRAHEGSGMATTAPMAAAIAVRFATGFSNIVSLLTSVL